MTALLCGLCSGTVSTLELVTELPVKLFLDLLARLPRPGPVGVAAGWPGTRQMLEAEAARGVTGARIGLCRGLTTGPSTPPCLWMLEALNRRCLRQVVMNLRRELTKRNSKDHGTQGPAQASQLVAKVPRPGLRTSAPRPPHSPGHSAEMTRQRKLFQRPAWARPPPPGTRCAPDKPAPRKT